MENVKRLTGLERLYNICCCCGSCILLCLLGICFMLIMMCVYEVALSLSNVYSSTSLAIADVLLLLWRVSTQCLKVLLVSIVHIGAYHAMQHMRSRFMWGTEVLFRVMQSCTVLLLGLLLLIALFFIFLVFSDICTQCDIPATIERYGHLLFQG